MKFPRLILTLSAVLLTASSTFAQAPAAAPAGNLLAAVKLDANSFRIPQIVKLPPEAKKLAISASVSCPEFKPMPLPGYGVGVWFLFQNDAGEELDSQGKKGKGPRAEGFPLGVTRSTNKPSLEKKTVAVPPGATRLMVQITEYDRETYAVGAASKPTVESLSAVVVP